MSLQALTANQLFLFETRWSEAIKINKMLIFSANMVTIFLPGSAASQATHT